MAFEIGAILGKLGLETSDFEKGVDKAGKSLDTIKTTINGVKQAVDIMLKSAFILKAIDEWKAWEQTIAKTDAILKATGKSAGGTSKQLIAMAEAFRYVSNFEEDAILNAESMLIAYKNIGTTVMPKATQAVLDMSAALGQDLASSAVMLGRVLDDPLQNIGMLTRMKINLTEVTKQEIKALAEEGKVFEAQNIILEQMEDKFGGVAKAMSETATGAITQMQMSMGDLVKETGRVVVEGIQPLVAGVTELLNGFMNLDADTRKLIITMVLIAASIGPVIAIGTQLITLIKGISLAMASNPIGLIVLGAAAAAVAVGALVIAFSDMQKKSEENLNALRAQDEATETLLNRYTALTEKGKLTVAEQEELAKILIRLKEVLPPTALEMDKYGKVLGINKEKAREAQLEHLGLEKQLNNSAMSTKALAYATLELTAAGLQEAIMTARKTGNMLYLQQAQEQLIAVGAKLREVGNSLQPFTDRAMEIQKDIKAIQDEEKAEQRAAEAALTTQQRLEAQQAQTIKTSAEEEKTTLKQIENSKKFVEQKRKEAAEASQMNRETVAEFKLINMSEYQQKVYNLDQEYAKYDKVIKDKDALNVWYKDRKAQLDAEEAKKNQEKLDKEKADQEKWRLDMNSAVQGAANYASGITSQLSSMSSQYYANKNAEIDNDYKTKKEYIEANVTDETEKANQLATLDKDYQKKKNALQLEAWKTNKGLAIANAVINTALAVSNALATVQPFIPMAIIAAGIAAAMGAVQIGLIASEPPPKFATGGNFMTNGPQTIMVGDNPGGRERVHVEPVSSSDRSGLGGDNPVFNFSGPINSEIDLQKAASSLAFMHRTSRREI